MTAETLAEETSGETSGETGVTYVDPWAHAAAPDGWDAVEADRLAGRIDAGGLWHRVGCPDRDAAFLAAGGRDLACIGASEVIQYHAAVTLWRTPAGADAVIDVVGRSACAHFVAAR